MHNMYMTKTMAVHAFRQQLGRCLSRVAAGDQVVVTSRGRPVARLIPEPGGEALAGEAHPLRGSVRKMSRDFDAPMDGLWDALRR